MRHVYESALKTKGHKGAVIINPVLDSTCHLLPTSTAFVGLALTRSVNPAFEDSPPPCKKK